MNQYLLKIAKLQRTLLWLIFALLMSTVGFVWIAAFGQGMLPNPDIAALIMLLVLAAIQLWAIIQTFRLTIAMKANIAYPIIMLLGGFIIPLLGLVMLLIISDKANKELKQAGLKVGFMGVPKSEWPNLMPGHCPECAYDRSGIDPMSPCPECGHTPTPDPNTGVVDLNDLSAREPQYE
ncbi:MAG: hypothetical protein CMJ35_00575 [Phycisphaerae bacterium]|mgnify:FL=1|nr:hypothetical protein [Phycisphaerae bacterium]MBM90094.1 hypothetical protein [Phycisphaerae bacterium]